MVPCNANSKVIDLFCGGGGFSLGAARAGFKLIGAIDNDPRALSIHRINFPSTYHIQEDISEVSGEYLFHTLNLSAGELDALIGGPPCQGFSVMGKNNADDSRNRLFYHFFRLVDELKPRFYLTENVPGILHNKFSYIINKSIRRISKDYHSLSPIVLAANEYGSPTTRKRIFFFGYHKDLNLVLSVDDFFSLKSDEYVMVKDALHGLPNKINPDCQIEEDSWRTVSYSKNGCFSTRLSGHIPKGVGDPVSIRRLAEESKVSGFIGTNHSKAILVRYRQLKQGSVDKVSRSPRLDPNGFCPTIRAGTNREHGSHQAVRPIHPTENRVITPREAARLQGFPDWFQFDNTKWHSFRHIGNSVSPILAEKILAMIKNKLFE